MSLLSRLSRLFNKTPDKQEQKHVAIVGSTNKGKTSLLAAMAAMVAMPESKSFFKQRVIKRKRIKVEIIGPKAVKLCPGKRHAWFNSNVGLIRKPIQYVAT
jgi:ABC-type branched-subunit amino acid transport system ATPase component